MFGRKRPPNWSGDLPGIVAALDRSMAVITFAVTGEILHANANFLDALGYRLADIVGRHHRLFVEPEMAVAPDYQEFWQRLGAGQFVAGQFLRRHANGDDVWIEASYNPVLDRKGRPYKIVKFATVITQQKNLQADVEGQIAAINKSMAVIEFKPDGTVLAANRLFLEAVEYELPEIVGRHHSLFCPPDVVQSLEYSQFWKRLGAGEFYQGQFRRRSRSGRTVWLEASYNPVFDARGRIIKVVKYAADITSQKETELQLATAVIETSAVVEAAKAGDLCGQIALGGKSGPLATVCRDVNALLGTTGDLVRSFARVADRIRGSAEQFSHDSVGLAQRADTQASSLQQTAATTEQLAASIKQSADHSREAARMGSTAHQLAEDGTETVKEAVTAMSRIETASIDIASIISVIDEIAFQTNLLALNAAVEAARAGDAGRGFAVVASEVRALSKRSSESAAGIRDLIANATVQVRSGVHLVEQTGMRLTEIVSAAEGVASAINEISRASAEQSRGVEDMASTVAQLDEMTNENASLAQRSAGVAADLLQDAFELTNLVQRYKIASVSISTGPRAEEAA